MDAISPSKRANGRGFTLIELMTVVAIAGILIALAAASFKGLRQRADLGSVTNDLISAISMAKARAMATNSNVWLLIYPNTDDGAMGGESPGPNGRYFVYEDRNGDFVFTAFDPENPVVGAQDRLLDRIDFIGHYTNGADRSKVSFGLQTVAALPAPFASLTCSDIDGDCACSFCSGAGTARRGAIVFRPDGRASFVDGDGNLVASALARLGLRGSPTSNRDFRIALSGPTAMVRAFSN